MRRVCETRIRYIQTCEAQESSTTGYTTLGKLGLRSRQVVYLRLSLHLVSVARVKVLRSRVDRMIRGHAPAVKAGIPCLIVQLVCLYNGTAFNVQLGTCCFCAAYVSKCAIAVDRVTPARVRGVLRSEDASDFCLWNEWLRHLWCRTRWCQISLSLELPSPARLETGGTPSFLPKRHGQWFDSLHSALSRHETCACNISVWNSIANFTPYAMLLSRLFIP
ncbi:hypothetical protein BJ546DRAFT_453217 [Cryomyces antarcticus]